MIQRSPSILRAAAAVAALAATACGSNGQSAATNLKAVFYKTMSNAPVVTFTLQRQNGAAIATTNAVSVDTSSTFKGWMPIGGARSVSTSASGVGSVALTSGTYPISINPGAALVGRFNDSLTVSADTARTYQTSQQSWNVSSTKPFRALRIEVYQTDASGKALYGTSPTAPDPLILSANVALTTNPTSSQPFNTELFKGTYRAVIIATPALATDTIAPFETGVINAAGAGAVEPQSVSLVASQNLIMLSLKDGAVAVPDAAVGTIETFDRTSLISLGTTTYTSGLASISTGSVGDVYVSVSASDGSLMTFVALTAATPATQKTLNRYAVTGQVKPLSGATITPSVGYYGTVNAYMRSSFGQPIDTWLKGIPSSPTAIADANGTYSMNLVEGMYDIKAEQVPGFITPKAVTLTAATTPNFNLSVDAGATISGNVQDQGKNNVANVGVSIYDSAHNNIAGGQTDVNGNYSIAVPAGTYDVFVGGALSGSPTVAALGTSPMTLTQFQINGRLIDAQSNPFAGRVRWGGGNVTTTTLGTYTLKAVQGLNWFQFSPTSNTSPVGVTYEPLVQVDANTFKSLP